MHLSGASLRGAALCLCVAGCGNVDVHMMPTPVVLKDPRLDFSRMVSAEVRSPSLPVFYATTRAAGTPGHYVDAAGDGVVLGAAAVRLGEPGWTWEQLLASDRASSVEHARAGAVERVEEFGKSEEAQRRFVAAIDAQLARSATPEVVLYVHGYRVNFDEVAVQMGSFAHYLNHGAVVTFQWPTGMNFWNYVTDCPRAEGYIPDIERLVALLAQTKAEKINLLAYSCGSPLLAAALARLRARHPDESGAQLTKRYRLGNVVFAASDVDLKTFAREHVPPILALAEQLIIYASRNDRALGFSSLIAGASRLGRPDINDLSPREIERLAADPRLQVVDVSDVRGAHEMGGMKGHGYWYANEWISSDILFSLRKPIPPATRCLVNAPNRARVWRMPDDYPDCLAARLLAAFPQIASGKPAP